MLLHTKLRRPPLQEDLVLRPRLLARLNANLPRRLTLIAAPAGFGKTTLAAAWLASMSAARPNPQSAACAEVGRSIPNPQSCWLALDPDDNDPNRFWQTVLAALQSTAPALGGAMPAALQANPLPPPATLLPPLLNDLADWPYPIFLALDDYHHIEHRAVHDGVRYLLDHAPPQLHIVLMTRADPPFPLGRLRAQDLLTELRADDLRFTEDEAVAFLVEKNCLTLSAMDLQTLMTRTEGWITGLRLIALSLQGQGDAPGFIADLGRGRRYIIEYLTEEVLHQQPAADQAFLLQTSILTRLCGPLCDAVTEGGDGQATLTRLQAADLFITPLDENGQWFRYHRLLADLLHARLQQTAAPGEIQALHARASRWYAVQQAWEPAIDHALAAADWSRAADLLAAAFQPLLAQGYVATWQRRLAQLPAATLATAPALPVRQGWAAFLNGDVAQAEVLLLAARADMAPADRSAAGRRLRGELAGYLATIAFFREEPTRIIQMAQEALALLPPADLAGRARATSALGLGVSLAGDTARAMDLFEDAAAHARGADNPLLLAHALELIADGQVHTGQLNAAAITCQAIIELATRVREAPLPFAANGHVKLAAIHVEQGALAQAANELAACRSLSQAGGIGYNKLQERCTQLRLSQALGNETDALAALRDAEAVVRQSQSHLMQVQLSAYAVPFWLQRGDLASAAAWVDSRALVGNAVASGELPVILQEVQQVALARVRLAQGRPEEVVEIAGRLIPQARTAGRLARAIELGLAAALAWRMKGEQAAALAALRPALALARPSGYRQLFVEWGEAMRRLLADLPPAEQSDYVRILLRAFPQPAEPPSDPLVEPLSARELEVLQRIAAGLSNKQIAEELIISLNTVKKHTTHIYGKLGVQGRTQAVARARALRLIE